MHNVFSIHHLHRLERLHAWLSYGGSSGLLFFAVLVIPYQLVLAVMLALGILFTPYMLWVLYRAEQYSWIAGFGLIVLLPALVSMMPFVGTLLRLFLQTLALVFFFLYCWALRQSVGDWMEMIQWQH